MKAGVGAHRLCRAARLRHPNDIQAVFQQGRREEQRAFVLLWRPSASGTRAAFAASRQIRGAVSRNRAKRRLREAYRRLETRPVRCDLVFVARPSALVTEAGEIEREMGQALTAVRRP